MQGALWVGLVGNIIIARVRGLPSDALIKECQEQVVTLLRGTPHRRILYDALEMETPSVEVALVQQKLSQTLYDLVTRIAIVVPDTRLAYLSRLAFGEGDYRVFYNDMVAALRWLDEGEVK
jgi:hypothetical protein